MPRLAALVGMFLATVVLLPGCGSSAPTGAGKATGAGGPPKPHAAESFGAVLVLKSIGEPVDGKAVLAELKKDWATDAETVALLQKLYGGLPVKLEIVQRSEKKPNEMKLEEIAAEQERMVALPPASFPIVLRVAFRPAAPVEEKDADPKDEPVSVESGLIAVFAQQPSDKAGDPGDATLTNATMLALNDYLLRKKKGCVLIQEDGWFGRDTFKKIGPGVEAFRKYTDEKADAFAKAFREHWGGRGVEVK
ncbi:MAG: hypothetical protein JNM56_00105 [Planctomycetia bacterium]|nr:hypothetical protein [Planctomycetia bacterium]